MRIHWQSAGAEQQKDGTVRVFMDMRRPDENMKRRVEMLLDPAKPAPLDEQLRVAAHAAAQSVALSSKVPTLDVLAAMAGDEEV